MAELADFMPPLNISTDELKKWGELWLGNRNPETGKTKNPNSFDRHQSVNFASFIDRQFAEALAVMLGNIAVEIPNGNSLLPSSSDCVEVGSVRIIGGIRPQNFDAAYRPDGPRVVFDSKTLNDLKQVSSTDTIHRVRVKDGIKIELLAATFLNSLTLAWSEVCGRSYGGGVLELEPREAEEIPIFYQDNLSLDTEKIDVLLRQEKIYEALDYVDSVVLKYHLGFDQGMISKIRNAWEQLRDRRTKRK
ncbi:MAG: hypothetical protein AB4041_17250 [Microcystaceae cyanobacterium]